MMGLSGLASVRKVGQIPNHLRHAGLKSWLDYTNNLYNQQYHGLSSAVHLPFPSQDTKMRKYEWVTEIME
jgi:hypothetical protein